MQRPTWTLCTAAILAGTVAGSVQYLTARPGAYAGGSVVTLETTCTASVSHPRVGVTALFAITDWLSKPFDYIDQKLGSWARAVKAVLVGVAVASAVLIVGGILVAAGAIAASGAAVAVLAVVAGIAAGMLTYALSKPPGDGNGPGGPNNNDGQPPPPPPPDDVFLRVRWESDQQKPDQARHLFACLDWRSKNKSRPESRSVTETDLRKWETALEGSLKDIKDDLSIEELKKNRVQLDVSPDPGPQTLNTVEDYIRKVFGKDVEIVRGPPKPSR